MRWFNSASSSWPKEVITCALNTDDLHAVLGQQVTEVAVTAPGVQHLLPSQIAEPSEDHR